MEASVEFGVEIESGVMGFGDPALQPTIDFKQLFEQLVDSMKDGRVVYVDTGGDGPFGVILRLSSDSLELLPSEGELISSLSNPVLLRVESGFVVAADFNELKNASKESRLSLEPGIYECMVHMCDNEKEEFLGFVAVFKKSTETMASNPNVFEVEQLG